MAVIRRCLKETCSINEKGKFDKDSESCISCAYNIEVPEEKKPFTRLAVLGMVLGTVLVVGITGALVLDGSSKKTNNNAALAVPKPSQSENAKSSNADVKAASSKTVQDKEPQEDSASQSIKIDKSGLAADNTWQNNELKEKYSQIINNAEGRLTVDFRFDRGTSALDENAVKNIDLLAEFLNSRKYSDHKITLIGFADNLGSYEENLVLSKQRAEEVKKQLLAKDSKFESRVATDGFGKEQPAASNDTAEGKNRNRRVEVWLMNK